MNDRTVIVVSKFIKEIQRIKKSWYRAFRIKLRLCEARWKRSGGTDSRARKIFRVELSQEGGLLLLRADVMFADGGAIKRLQSASERADDRRRRA